MKLIGKIRKLISGLGRRYLIFASLCPLIMIAEVLLETLIPLLMARIVDDGIVQRDMDTVLKNGGIMIACSLLSLACGVAAVRFGAVAAHGFGHNLRERLFKKIQAFSFSNIDDFSTASLITRLTTDVTNTQNVFMSLIRICFRAPFMLLFGTLMAFMLNARLALVFLFSIPFLAVVIIVISTKAYSRFAAMLEKYDRLNTIVQENLIAVRVVKAYVRAAREKEKFEGSAADVRDAHERAEKLSLALEPIMQLTVYSTIIAVYWFGGKMVAAGGMLPGDLISFLSYVHQILMSLMMLAMIFVNIVLSSASVRRILEVLDAESTIAEPAGAVTEIKDGSVEFDKVDFSYSDDKEKCVLKNVSLKIKSGQTVGIIGGTGSSKSTLVSLIPRLYDVTEGSVKVGGVDVRACSLEALRSAVCVVLQKNLLFSGTIAENLRWGNPLATDAEIKEACMAAAADEFIDSFPDGYGTLLGQGGVNLSGGQKQRLCIARALLRRPKILILDDSTSACDTATESRIQKALASIMPDVTKIIISQRIASVKDADVIYVLDEGKIDAHGKHSSLLKSSAIYREVAESQKSLGDADAAG